MAEPTSTIVQYLQHLVGVMRADPRSDAELLARFVNSRDEEAFRVLVGRYAPLVWGNCRRILGATPDAEDAFQAAFLALACKATKVRAETLANWLYRISERIALNSRKALLRRLRHETHAAVNSHSPTSPALISTDDDQVIWEELENLPERLRTPLVLYYLNGKTQAEAGRVLGISDRAVAQRLEQALTRLRNRLASRGFAITVAALAASLSQAATIAATIPLPEEFLQRVATATAEGHVSPSIANLAARALAPRTGLWIIAALLVAVGGACSVAVLLLAGSKEPPVEASVVQIAPAQSKNDLLLPNSALPTPWATLKGQVTDEAGHPVPQARLTVLARSWNQRGAGLRDEMLDGGTTDANGQFQLPVVKTVPGEVIKVWLSVSAPGVHTVIPIQVAGGVIPNNIPVRLTPQLIAGRVVDPKGHVLSGATVRVIRFGGAAFEPLRPEHKPLPAHVWPAPVTTGPDGRFTFTGLDEAADLTLAIVHPESGMTSVLNLPKYQAARNDIEVRMTRTRRFTGRVLAADTGRPLSSAQVVVDFQTVAGGPPLVRNTYTDSNGAFSLAVPQTPRWIVEVMSVPRPYLGVRRIIELPDGDDVVTDIRVERGVVVRGHVTDSSTSRPIHMAKIRFFPHTGEQNENEAIESVLPHTSTNAEGNFALAIPPTGGVLVATAPNSDYALVSVDPTETRGRFYAAHAVATFAPGEPPETSFRLERGCTIHGRVFLPDGSPVPGGWVWCSRLVGGRDLQTPYALTIEDGRFAIPGCRPDRAYSVVLADRTLRHGTIAKILYAKEPATVKLQPTGSATIDVRNSSDRPVAGAIMTVELGLPEDETPGEEPVETHWFPLASGGPVGPDGQRLLPGLVPGARYRIGVRHGLGFGHTETIKTVSSGGHEQATLVLPSPAKK